MPATSGEPHPAGAVDTSQRWRPEGGDQGTEFSFLFLRYCQGYSICKRDPREFQQLGLPSVAALLDSHSAVHGECVTDDVAGCRTAKKQHGRGDLVWPASASDGDVLGNLGVRLFVAADHIAGNLRIDQSGIDGIHADTVLDV